MNEFWNNISRYPRFFISSVLGLIIIILTPFKNIFSKKKFRLLIPIFFLIIINILSLILANMTNIKN
uniref:Uncharacterized protein ycf33 n=1 Tax=Climaconeis cf. scalaris TaxID=2846828 RepID=A0A8F8X8B7_9STRA|nr:hypothetical chloroplast RF33 [Climaconeis cf. scalaris]